MPQEDALLKAVLADPDDDAPRLIYADWLDENGQAERAEFIRVQCELARTDDDDPRWPDLEAREAQLLRDFSPSWDDVRMSHRMCEHPIFRRGFLNDVDLTANQFFAKGEELFRLFPIRQVRLWGTNGVVKRLAESHLPTWLTSLDMSVARAARRDWQRLFSSPCLRNLKAFGFVPQSEDSLRDFASAPLFPHLEELRLWGGACTPSTVSIISDSPDFGKIKKFQFSLVDNFVAVLNAVMRSTRAADLTELVCGSNEAGPLLASSVASWPRLRQLRKLVLYDEAIGNAGAEALSASPYFNRVRDLWLDNNGITQSGVGALVSSRSLRNIRSLSLDNNDIGNAGAIAIATSTGMCRLSHLFLRKCGLGDRAAEALAASPHLTRLNSLYLGENAIGERGISALVQSSLLSRFCVLYLSRTSFNSTVRRSIRKRFGGIVQFE